MKLMDPSSGRPALPPDQVDDDGDEQQTDPAATVTGAR